MTGIKFKGAGSSLTTIYFSPTAAAEIAYNSYWQNISFEGITFAATVPDCTFFHSDSGNWGALHYAQHFTFTDVEWVGTWKYIATLTGGDNNSEWTFLTCSTYGMQDNGTFLYVAEDQHTTGGVNTSDQFLNFWFYAHKHWLTDTPLIDMAQGGHVHMYGVDCSAWGENLTAQKHLINLRVLGHGTGVQSFTANGLRVEGKSAKAGLLYSEWGDGNVTIECDWSSQVWSYSYGDVITLNVGDNTVGAMYNFHDSALAGGVKVMYAGNSWRYQRSIYFNSCIWYQRQSPSDVVSYTDAGFNPTNPLVHFTGCRAAYTNPPARGYDSTIWDATISYNRGQPVKSGTKRSIIVQGLHGNVTDADAPGWIASLPVGATITAIKAISSPGTNSDTNGGNWIITTSEPTPTTLSTLTATGSLANGYNLGGELPIPYMCDTRQKADIVVKSSGITNATNNGFVVIEGWW